MSLFPSQIAFSEGPKRNCPDKLGGLFAVFKPTLLTGHELAGYEFRPNPCVTVETYDPDFCEPAPSGMTPDTYDGAKPAVLGMIQAAITCSLGATMEEMIEEARGVLMAKIQLSVETSLVSYLETNATDTIPGAGGDCVLGSTAQYLATNSYCGRGLIVGPTSWFVTRKDLLVWNGKYHTDFIGNIVIPHSVDNDTGYALDPSIDIKLSDPLILDEIFPSVRVNNTRTVRAQMLYTIAIDSCKIGSIDVDTCA